MLVAAFAVAIFAAGMIAVVLCIPLWNKLFDRIWEDPTARQRREVRQRLNELHVDGHVPEEIAVLMAAKEYGKTEKDILAAAELLKPSDIAGMMTGRTSILGVMLHGVERAIKRGVRRA